MGYPAGDQQSTTLRAFEFVQSRLRLDLLKCGVWKQYWPSVARSSRIQDFAIFFLFSRWVTQSLKGMCYITCINLQRGSFRYSISSEDLNMTLFLRLPRELRDRIYDQCLVAARLINLQNLAPLSKNSVS